MPKVIAATLKASRLHLALHQIKTFALTVTDFMYGTEQRTRFTVAFAFGMVILGSLLQTLNETSQYCSN